MLMLLVYLSRTVPPVELEAVSEFLRNLLTGDVDRLPTETLVHTFWTLFAGHHKQAVGYLRCLTKHELTKVKCYNRTNAYCGFRFGDKPAERLEHCRRSLSGEKNATGARIFDDYRSCFRSYRRQVDANCTATLRKAITERRLRAAKVVRATMDSMGPLLRTMPALRIIHLVRDPRAVALSRIRFGPSGKGLYYQQVHRKKTGSRFVAEATQYCHHVIADIRTRLELEREFPGRIKSVRYEDVVDNPEQRFREVYELLDEPVPENTLNRMQTMAYKGQKRNLTTKWQYRLAPSDQREIARHCDEFFRLLGVPADWNQVSATTVMR